MKEKKDNLIDWALELNWLFYGIIFPMFFLFLIMIKTDDIIGQYVLGFVTFGFIYSHLNAWKNKKWQNQK